MDGEVRERHFTVRVAGSCALTVLGLALAIFGDALWMLVVAAIAAFAAAIVLSVALVRRNVHSRSGE